MSALRGFLEVKRSKPEYRPVCERIGDFREAVVLRGETVSVEQASRCMDCGTPFCAWACPLGNYIPEWNDLVFRKHWREAYFLLQAGNNLPEITGRVCPALCEYSCVLGINDEPVTIRENELAVIEYAFAHGLAVPRIPKLRTGKRAAIIGSGPAGLACADQLNQAGHSVVIFERDDKTGGILRYGIPDFKLEKWVLDRRLALLKEEGIKFVTRIDIGRQYPVNILRKEFDAVCLAGGARMPRDLNIEGRNLKGIYFAMDFLEQANRRTAGLTINNAESIHAKDMQVIVIGGGDTGADCVGVAHRQGARAAVQIEVLPQPPECRPEAQPWPYYPMLLKTSTSHEEGGQRVWSVLAKRFIGEKGRVKKIACARVEYDKINNTACPVMKEIPGSEFGINADLVILAAGFIRPEHEGLLEQIGAGFDVRGNVKTGDNFMSDIPGIFCAGDMRRGQSLIVWAVSEGRKAARAIDAYLTGRSLVSEM